jgi:acyl carrier protein
VSANRHLHDQLNTLFRQRLHLDVPANETDLVDAGLLDSLQFVQLLLHLEEDFGLHVAMEDLNIDHFRSIVSIADFVSNHSAAADPSAARGPHSTTVS